MIIRLPKLSVIWTLISSDSRLSERTIRNSDRRIIIVTYNRTNIPSIKYTRYDKSLFEFSSFHQIFINL